MVEIATDDTRIVPGEPRWYATVTSRVTVDLPRLHCGGEVVTKAYLASGVYFWAGRQF